MVRIRLLRRRVCLLYTSEHTYIRRTDVMGAIEPDRLPGWAKEKAAALRQDYQREKAAEKQRLEEFLTARREKAVSYTHLGQR